MAKASPWLEQCAAPPRARETRTITDAATGYAFELTLEEMDEPALGQATDLLVEYQGRYLSYGKDGRQRSLILPNGSGRARLSEYLLRQVAMLATMERPEPGETAWGVLEWYGVASRHPDAWRQALAFANSVGAVDPNPPGETEPTPTETGSPSP